MISKIRVYGYAFAKSRDIAWGEYKMERESKGGSWYPRGSNVHLQPTSTSLRLDGDDDLLDISNDPVIEDEVENPRKLLILNMDSYHKEWGTQRGDCGNQKSVISYPDSVSNPAGEYERDVVKSFEAYGASIKSYSVDLPSTVASNDFLHGSDPTFLILDSQYSSLNENKGDNQSAEKPVKLLPSASSPVLSIRAQNPSHLATDLSHVPDVSVNKIIDLTPTANEASIGPYGTSQHLLPSHTMRGTTAGRDAMLTSFPPPTRVDRDNLEMYGPQGMGLFIGIEQREAGDTHCHSKVDQHNMNQGDKLAQRQLLIVLILCVLFMIGETVGGVLANSLALFTDVLHLASDLISYIISLLALYLSKKVATKRMTFGYHRAEVLGALFSVFIIWLVSGVLCYIAVERIIHQHYKDVKPNEMLITASLGVVFNLIMGFVLHSEKCCGSAKGHARFGHGHSHSHDHSHGPPSRQSRFSRMAQGGHIPESSGYEPLNSTLNEDLAEEDIENALHLENVHKHKNINVRAAFIHVVGDIIQSLGVLVAALIIKFRPEDEYRLADPICTFLFSLLVLLTTKNVLQDALRIILEGAPPGMDFQKLKSILMSIDSVLSVHNLNIWALTMDRNALSVHLAVDNSRHSDDVLTEANKVIEEYNFYHVTIQVESYQEIMKSCHHCKLPIN